MAKSVTFAGNYTNLFDKSFSDRTLYGQTLALQHVILAESGVSSTYDAVDEENDDLKRRLGYMPDLDNVPDMAGVRTTIDNRKSQSRPGILVTLV